jgi:putative heme-binding domain-containing protein
VTKTDLIACLAMLAIDAVPTPQGDLLVCCHSGAPDWGTGPQGKGKLFKISYADKHAPQPVLAYALSPTETEIVFDRMLDVNQIPTGAMHSRVAMGKYVSAGEQFESFRPGYQAVKNQRTMPRFELPVMSARVSDDQRSLILQTTARTESVNYAVTVPGAVAGSSSEIDLQTDLSGVEATWKPTNGSGIWTGWLPHPDLTVARSFTVASEAHRKLFNSLKQRGTLTLRTKLDLWQMLRSATQPDSKLDFEYPPETVTVLLKASSNLELKVGTNVVSTGGQVARLTTQPRQHRWLPIEVTLATGGNQPGLDVSWLTAEDPRPRPLPLRRVMLPWAQPYLAVAVASHTPELESGSWQRGKELFFGDQATCYKCHKIGGEGGNIGADLSNLIYRDYASVLWDITEPSAAINPEHIAYNVQFADGEVESGVLLKNNQEEVVLGQVTGKSLKIPKTKITGMKASTISLMPEGLLKGLNDQQQKDLMTFLLTVQ